MNSDVFISYVNEDEAIARELFGSLDNNGTSAWIDHRIPVGESWDTFILNKIKNAKSFVALISINSLQKSQELDSYIRKEWNFVSELVASTPNYIFVPVLLNRNTNLSDFEIRNNDKIPDIIKSKQAFKLDTCNTIRELVLVIKRLLKEPIITLEKHSIYNFTIKAEIAQSTRIIDFTSFWIVDRISVDQDNKWVINLFGFKAKHKIELKNNECSIVLYLRVKYDMLRGSIRNIKIDNQNERTLLQTTFG